MGKCLGLHLRFGCRPLGSFVWLVELRQRVHCGGLRKIRCSTIEGGRGDAGLHDYLSQYLAERDFFVLSWTLGQVTSMASCCSSGTRKFDLPEIVMPQTASFHPDVSRFSPWLAVNSLANFSCLRRSVLCTMPA